MNQPQLSHLIFRLINVHLVLLQLFSFLMKRPKKLILLHAWTSWCWSHVAPPCLGSYVFQYMAEIIAVGSVEVL